MASLAVTSGPDDAVREAGRLASDADDRCSILAAAARQLLFSRHYPAAAHLFAEAKRGTSRKTELRWVLELLPRLRRHEELRQHRRDPADVLRALLAEIFLGERSWTSIADTYLTRDLAELYREAESSFAPELTGDLEPVRRRLRDQDIPLDAIVDLVVAAISVHVEGDAARGWRASVTFAGPNTKRHVFYLASEAGAIKVIGARGDFGAIAREALRRLDAGDLDGARVWLDRVREEVDDSASDDPFAVRPVARLWPKGGAGAERLRLAAASLLSGTRGVRDAEPILARCREHAPDEKAACDAALAYKYFAGQRWEALYALTSRILAGAPDSKMGFTLAYTALLQQNRWDEARRLAEERLARDPRSIQAIGLLAEVAVRRHDFAAARREYDRLLAVAPDDALTLNTLAWLSLVDGHDLEQALERARRAATLTGHAHSDILNTVAALEAATGRLHDAYVTTLLSMDKGGAEEPRPQDWLVLGQIAQGYGLVDLAASAYRKALAKGRAKPRDQWHPLSVESLAEARLRALPRR